MKYPIWIDEVDFLNFNISNLINRGESEHFHVWEPNSETPVIFDTKAWNNLNDPWLLERQKRKKAMKNCLHGQRYFVIHWAPGILP